MLSFSGLNRKVKEAIRESFFGTKLATSATGYHTLAMQLSCSLCSACSVDRNASVRSTVLGIARCHGQRHEAKVALHVHARACKTTELQS